MRNSVNNAMRQRNFSDYLKDKEAMTIKDREILIVKIDSGEVDTDELKSDFNETLYAKGYEDETVREYTDEHFENLLSFEENERKFIKWYNQNSVS